MHERVTRTVAYGWIETTLRAEVGDDDGCGEAWARVEDLDGGVWYASPAAIAEILGQVHPAMAAIEMCVAAPTRGTWQM